MHELKDTFQFQLGKYKKKTVKQSTNIKCNGI